VDLLCPIPKTALTNRRFPAIITLKKELSFEEDIMQESLTVTDHKAISASASSVAPALSQMLIQEKDHVCFFTGHRTIPQGELLSLREVLLQQIEALYYQGYTVFLSGGARGFDLLAASAALLVRRHHPEIRVIMVIPCRDQDLNWSRSDSAFYRELLLRCETCPLSDEPYRRGCMQKRNRFMVDHASLGIAYHKHARSGTEMTVRYAEKKGVSIINLRTLLEKKQTQTSE